MKNEHERISYASLDSPMILKRKKYGLLKRVSTGVDRFICVTCQRLPLFEGGFVFLLLLVTRQLFGSQVAKNASRKDESDNYA